ncbi:MAG: hypothetical protein SPL73_06000 [Cyanobacteriota bacterium]|nr:hypothetical protein [Cyanobacteriota bacterium]MDY6358780.1 hypothetical protein [Cyanobacteriota bacterium]MDY6364425.1 hypothetical protein [Cyanobacteriota bacterium]MDY6383138.1 hypothetical protein [Cyanobacteriota bacterium]
MQNTQIQAFTPEAYDSEQVIIGNIISKYERFDDERSSQKSDNRAISYSIYNTGIPKINDWDCHVQLPEIYELAQTLKSHIVQNLYSHPDGMFDVSGTDYQSQKFANSQKAMLVNTFEEMKIENEMEKIIDSVVETGEVTLFVGWETKTEKVRRSLTLEEQIASGTNAGFIIEDKTVYDNAKVKFINYEDFVFDRNSVNNWDSCPKIYKTYQTLDEIKSNKSNNMLNEEKLEILKGVVAKNSKTKDEKYSTPTIEVLEYWGDIELPSGEILKNQLICTAGRSVIIRFEDNPFIINPFIHANIIENPITGRGISPLRVALILNNISSTILNKQLDALALMMNPPYLAPKGCFTGRQEVYPGKVIEYDSTLMTTPPTPLSFDKAMTGWDFLSYFKNTIESATGIFKNMAGNIQSQERTATEINYSVNGQEARLNMILESINRKIIIPMVEKTAQLISYFKIGKECILINDHGRTNFVDIDDKIRNSNYVYRYGDRRAIFEKKSKFKELFDVVSAFTQIDEIAKRINWSECFKFALEQYGVENSNKFLKDKEET